MAGYKIFFSNIGYARGIDGTLAQHLRRVNRYLYCGEPLQKAVLTQLKDILTVEAPDLCCLVEVDQGSFLSAYYNQLQFLADGLYPFYDISNKYGQNNWLGKLPPFKGKSSAFLAREYVPFEKLYFVRGTKRLIYRLELPGNIFLFFAHFSLQRGVRAQQFAELHRLIKAAAGEVIIMADFNIMQGFSELRPLLEDTNLKVLNDELAHTFTFHRYRWTLDLCICSESLAARADLKIIHQPFSDHAALLLELKGS